MNVKFQRLVDQMPRLLEDLKTQPLRTLNDLVDIPQRGVYVFYENNKALYVGRSNRVRRRLKEHGLESSTHNKASFAFNLAKDMMKVDEKLPLRIPRRELAEAPGFDRAFWLARRQVSGMKIRVIQIEGQVTQALFEIYAALALNCRYNKFSTH